MSSNNNTDFDTEGQGMEQCFTVVETSCSTSENWTEGRKKKRTHRRIENVSTPPKTKHAKTHAMTTRGSNDKNSTHNTSQRTQYEKTRLTSTPASQSHRPEQSPPPIFLRKVSNFKKLCSDLIQIVGDKNFKCRSRFNDILINSADSNSYRQIIRYLNESSADYHCYQLPEDKSYRVVIRHLHHTTPTEDIKTELAEKGYRVIRVHNALHPVTRAPLPLFFVDLKKEEKSREIFNEKYLQYTKIKVEEPRRRKDPVQCFRCQEYGHSQAYCHHEARCVKCSGQHDTKSCTKSPQLPAQCSNCGKQHPANYRGCEIFKAIKTLRTKSFAAKKVAAPSPPQGKPPDPASHQGTSRTAPVNTSSPPPVTNPTYASLLQSTLQRKSTQAPKTQVNPTPTQSNSSSLPRPSVRPPPISSSRSNPTPDPMPQIESFFTRLETLLTPLITLLTTLVNNLLPKVLK